MRYCRNCDQSYSSDFTFCPKCATRLMSEAETEEYIREREREANERNEEERLRRQDKEMCAHLLPILDKYKERGIYEAICSYRDIREYIRIAEIKNYSFSHNDLCKLYDIVVAHKKNTKESLSTELYQRIRGIEDKLKKLESILSNHYDRKNANQYFCYGSFERAWLYGGTGEIAAEYEEHSYPNGYRSHVYANITIKKYSFSKGVESRRGEAVRYYSDEIGIYYYLLNYECMAIEGRLNDAIRYFNAYFADQYKSIKYNLKFTFAKNMLKFMEKQNVMTSLGQRSKTLDYED